MGGLDDEIMAGGSAILDSWPFEPAVAKNREQSESKNIVSVNIHQAFANKQSQPHHFGVYKMG